MNDVLRTADGSPSLRFERHLAHPPEKVWRALTEPEHLSQWYPFPVTEMELAVGGSLRFTDEEGTVLHAEITELEPPRVFAFHETDEEGTVHRLRFVLEPDGAGCVLTFTHAFDDLTWAAHTAAGWHQCLEVLAQVVAGDPVTWPDGAAELRRAYAEQFGLPAPAESDPATRGSNP